MKLHDIVTGALAAVFAVLVFLHAHSFPLTPGQNIGPGFFPKIIAAGILGCGLVLVWRGFSAPSPRRWAELPAWGRNARSVTGFLLVPACLLFFVLTAEQVGFIPLAFALLLVLFLAFRVPARNAVFASLAGGLVIHFLFYKILKVPLPWGWLAPLAW